MTRLKNLQRGSALVESVILMTVMLPLIFGVAMIGKLIDLRQTSEIAGRYAAWEATVYSQAADGGSATPGQLRSRFFGNTDNALTSRPSEPGSHSLWGEQAGDGATGLAAHADVTIDDSSVAAAFDQHGVGSPTVAMQVGAQAGAAGEVLDGLKGNDWGLNPDGMVRATVGVQVKGHDWLQSSGTDGCGGDGSVVCLQSDSVILADGWSASDDDQARRRVRSLMPASALQPLGDIVSNVGHLPMFKELKKLDGAFGHVDMGVLPEYAQ